MARSIRNGLLAALLGVIALPAAAQTDSARLARGRYLGEVVMACGSCHDGADNQGRPLPNMPLAGGIQFNEPPAFRAVAPNISQDRETGIGAWTDAQIVAALREGRRPDGTPIDLQPAVRAMVEGLREGGADARYEAFAQFGHGEMLRVSLERETALNTGLADHGAWTPEELGRECDLAVVVGGDGTMLGIARQLAPFGTPLVGINQGRLGFMVDVPPAEMREVLTAVFAGDYVREQRLLLSTRLIRERRPQISQLAVNDVVIRNQAAIRMLEFETWIDGEFISQHRADGFIVASPTGSTAYALSGGGPVVHPGLDALTLVPICPHTLSDRPIVVSSRQTVRITLRGAPNTVAMYTCDSQTAETLHAGESFEVREADFRMNLVHPRQYSYFNILRSKLNWGRGPALNLGNGAEGNIR